MAKIALREIDHVTRGGHDGAVGQPWRYLAEAIGQECERYRSAGHGVPDEDEDERGQAGSRQPGVGYLVPAIRALLAPAIAAAEGSRELGS
jgi:hypothetical protein